MRLLGVRMGMDTRHRSRPHPSPASLMLHGPFIPRFSSFARLDVTALLCSLSIISSTFALDRVFANCFFLVYHVFGPLTSYPASRPLSSLSIYSHRLDWYSSVNSLSSPASVVATSIILLVYSLKSPCR